MQKHIYSSSMPSSSSSPCTPGIECEDFVPFNLIGWVSETLISIVGINSPACFVFTGEDFGLSQFSMSCYQQHPYPPICTRLPQSNWGAWRATCTPGYYYIKGRRWTEYQYIHHLCGNLVNQTLIPQYVGDLPLLPCNATFKRIDLFHNIIMVEPMAKKKAWPILRVWLLLTMLDSTGSAHLNLWWLSCVVAARGEDESQSLRQLPCLGPRYGHGRSGGDVLLMIIFSESQIIVSPVSYTHLTLPTIYSV